MAARAEEREAGAVRIDNGSWDKDAGSCDAPRNCSRGGEGGGGQRWWRQSDVEATAGSVNCVLSGCVQYVSCVADDWLYSQLAVLALPPLVRQQAAALRYQSAARRSSQLMPLQ